MRIAYFDCFSGASGDMIIASLLGAGLRLALLERELRKLPLRHYSLAARRVLRAGFAATKFNVAVQEDGHPHERGLADILRLVRRSKLSARVKEKSAEIFQRLAEAEAEAHGKPVERVHFHEVGAVDSIIDVVGSVAALELLRVERVECSALALGNGTIRCAHGVLPVPAPGTAALLKGIPVLRTEVEGELTTPTGAAILTTLAGSFGSMPAMTIESVGVGAGAAERPELPNLLRVFIGESATKALVDELAVIETNLDDVTGQLAGALYDRLFGVGALDVFLTPIQMKKNRPGVLLTVLAPPEKLAAVQRTIFEETPTFGLRVSLAQRQKLEREWKSVRTPYGPVRVKIGKLGRRVLTASPEYEDCRRLAEQKGVPLRKVYAAAQAAIASC